MTLHTLQIGMEWFTEHPGGLNRVYANLLQQLVAQGVACEGLVSGSPDVARVSNGLARAFAKPDTWLPRRMWALRRAASPWLAAHSQDGVVVSHFALHALPILDHARRRPFVVHFQGPWAEESRVEGGSALSVRAKERVEASVYRAADAVIVLSSTFGRMLSARFAIPQDRVHVIPGGVEAARFDVPMSRAAARAQLEWPADRPTVLCVRRLVKRVGIELLIDAAVEIRKRVPGVLIQIVGTGPLRSLLSARIVALGLNDTVKLIGFLRDEELPLAYRAADLTVVPTISLEGFGLVTVESLAAGTPCLVTPIDGLREIIEPFSPHLVIEHADSGAIAVKITQALLGEIAVPSSTECAAYARAGFDWPVIAGRVRAVYEKASQ